MEDTMRAFMLLVIAMLSLPAFAEKPVAPARVPIQQAMAHPLFDDPYMCSEHAENELPHLGDALGQDCMITAFGDDTKRSFLGLYRNDGARNQDWYGWNRPVNSPCDCEVVKLHVNPLVNVPGQPHESRASSIILRATDGTVFVVAHLQAFAVKEGDHVEAGELIGLVGNNGYARAPHVHIGAWRGKQALQVRWDQQAMKVH
ncbi:M23 family metallopeptidase [Pseudoxanthomonas sp. 3HH-4]|uniref:M23 family metallopeptidase n=1 Tax=Pseudoxanthomonas sp. 3HH-4 TaxID=1690214 RepID=UPI0011541A56|nr:M23 family metallopeptidase [Pseudoxanthomonas sp. 3HH-4]